MARNPYRRYRRILIGYDIRRCKSGIIYSLNQLANEGHVFAVREQLIKETNERLGLDSPISEHSSEQYEIIQGNQTVQLEQMVAEPAPQMRPPVEPSPGGDDFI